MLAETLGVQHLGLFVISGLLLNLTPGQDTLYILGHTRATSSTSLGNDRR